MDEIHAPVLIGGRPARAPSPMQADALAPSDPHPDLQSLEPIEPVDAFVVHDPTLPSEHDLDAQIAKPGSSMREVADPMRNTDWSLAVLRRYQVERRSSASRHARFTLT